MANRLFKSDLFSTDLLEQLGRAVSSGPAPPTDSNDAGNFVSNLLQMQQERTNVDPFVLLREAFDV